MSTRSVGTIKLPNDATKFYDGTGAFDTVKDSDLDTSDITTNNVSTSKHGFAPKAPNDAAKYLDGTGAYSVPGSSSGGLVLIASTTVVGSDAAAITFSSIPGTYKHLKIVAQLRSTVSAAADNVQIRFNNDSTGAYDSNYVLAKNTAITSTPSHAQTSGLIALCAAATATRSTQASCIDITISNYTGTTFEKYAVGTTVAQDSNAAAGMYTFTTGIVWTVTPVAITQVDLFAAGGNLKIGSIATLYGMA